MEEPEPDVEINRSTSDAFQSDLPETFQDLLERTALLGKEKRSTNVYLKSYWKILLLVAVFYAVPSIQFVLVVYNERQDSHQSVFCYYNYKCNQTLGSLEAFNNVISNAGYVLAGLLFNLLVLLRDNYNYKHRTETGLHNDVSLFYALGWSLSIEGVFSALYHICPSKMNFQFDTTFMTIGTALLFIALYQKRHGTVTTGAFRAFGWLGAIVLLNVLSLVNIPTTAFWVIVLVILTYVSILGSFNAYGYRKVGFNRHMLSRLARFFLRPSWPRNKGRFLVLFVANVFNYAICITVALRSWKQSYNEDFPNFVMGVLMLDLFIYLIYYIVLKYINKERVVIPVWFLIVGMLGCFVSAIWFYSIAVTNKFLTPEESAKLNKPCVLFGYFDDHDVWHFLSAIGVVIFYLVVYFLDVDVRDRPPSEIKVF
eukprot:TRINITY_DN1389_c0_g1_i2.p1 TRINITY_DN1389_c0_g1~~TRINITY_DN1389_c0_g1_i2.p1  ORF type:complete len:426 (-),score=81.42 TRINITY_DN1389_c0_g1_i2:49-1326(-)